MHTRDLDGDQYDELSAYTLTHPDPAFIHQYVVDAFAARHAHTDTRPITLAFALVGLYVHLELHRTGRQVQRIHTLLARRRRQWPTFELPEHRGDITVADVLAAPAGPERDAAIETWCAAVWDAYSASHAAVVELVNSALRE
jgi:hypothetical protein